MPGVGSAIPGTIEAHDRAPLIGIIAVVMVPSSSSGRGSRPF
jgi:hypothetical protein